MPIYRLIVAAHFVLDRESRRRSTATDHRRRWTFEECTIEKTSKWNWVWWPRVEFTWLTPLLLLLRCSYAIGTGQVGDPAGADAEEERRLRLGALRAASTRWPGRESTTGRGVHQSSSQVNMNNPSAIKIRQAYLCLSITNFSQHFRNELRGVGGLW